MSHTTATSMNTTRTRVSITISRDGSGSLRSQDLSNQDLSMHGKTPVPVYRHAAPSGPWPWMDFDEDFPVVGSTSHGTTDLDTHSWKGYPQNLFPNWTERQVKRCRMLTACPDGNTCHIFKVDVFHDGGFDEVDEPLVVYGGIEGEFWEQISVLRPENIRVRALFVDNMSKQVLQMLGTKYVVEPFFFSSSINWIPSRYQEEVKPREGDHITITLPFIRAVQNPRTRPSSPTSPSSIPFRLHSARPDLSQGEEQVIDTQSPLVLRSTNKMLLQDLLAIHMVRNTKSSTVISYHPNLRRASAKRLHRLVQRIGQSVYWSKIFESSKDSTFFFLCFLWYAIYEWDEAFEILYAHINWLEHKVLDTNKIKETRELHILQAHLLYYQSLLEDFRRSVVFVQRTPNPAMEDPSVTEQERSQSARLLEREASNLLSEIERLEGQICMQSNRLKNVMDLAFSSVNIEDSSQMKRLTQATVRDSAAMKQISYLTMVFLPANFVAAVFGMNVREISGSTSGETLARYAAVTISLTIFTAWLVIAFQTESTLWRRAGWPMFYLHDKLTRKKADIENSR
ncbi:hypothetical protein PAXRUDRAFT_833344 [Paxillus rubicundulus Ve08.2h10]|uniref:Unplaced genomic scaffold scaffold_1121, whole genome shotgun sequence n=1 Tax=Paxillus rubicundulus Ve08.2h10 TaxID=930991 RepID=A0A0D0CYN2_9AGAM|nr:hypothetical protein PAXRUDRAFT_833344 [Paxillus rubicundulus Ve08.2h10]